MIEPYYVRVPFQGDNVVELIQFGDSGGHNEIKFGKTKARQAITYYARNDIEIDGDVICERMEVQGELKKGEKPEPSQISVSAQVPKDRLEDLIDGAILINGEKLPEDYKIDAMGGKF